MKKVVNAVKPKPVVDTDFDLTVRKKKKPSDLEAVTKKKKEPSMEIVVTDPPPKKKKAPATDLVPNKAMIQSIFGNDAEEMVKLLEEGEEDSALGKINKRLIQSSINLIAQIEKGIHDSNGRYGVHGYVNLVSTIRELMIDLQNTKDRGAIGQNIAENIMRPVFLDMATAVMHEYGAVAADVKDIVEPEIYEQFRKVQKDSRDKLAAMMQESYFSMRDQTIEYLQR